MLVVDVRKTGSIEKSLKELKKKFGNTGIAQELRERKEYTKPSVIRRRVIKKAEYMQKIRNED